MADGLFRKEVLASRQVDRLGGLHLQPPTLGWAFLIVGGLCVTALLTLLLLGHYTRHERVGGVLVPNGGLLSVSPLSAGVVVRTLVVEGSTVQAGQALAELSAEQDSAALGGTRAAVLAQLHLKRSQLDANLADAKHASALKRQELASHIDTLRAQIAQIDSQTALQKQRVDLTRSLYEKWQTLSDSGIVTKLQVLQQHDAALQSEVQLRELNRQALDARQQLAQVSADMEQIPGELNTRSNDIRREIADVAQAISENEAQRAVVLRAPADGIVVNITVHPGQLVAAQQAMMAVLPTHSTLQAELWLPSRAVGFVKAGDRVVMRYQAYPYEKFGEQYGRVGTVSHTALAPAEVSRLMGATVTEPRYRVLVELDRQSLLAYGQPALLKPGMELDADVLLDHRRLIEWVLEPLFGATHAFHSAPTGGLHP